MNDPIDTVIQSTGLNAVQVALISIGASIITFLVTNWFKNYFENQRHQRNLETEHKFEEQKKIKEAIAKHKVHLLTACEDLNHRLWNLKENHLKQWINVGGDYKREHYYFHSTVYKILCLYAWIGKVKKEMIFLDTTIASKEDLEFIKFLRFFPNVMCDLGFIVGKDADGDYAVDHFFRTNFELFPDQISDESGPVSYSNYKIDLEHTHEALLALYEFVDGISPLEKRMRWDRFHLLHLTTIIFLNNYGYDFQRTNELKIEDIIVKPRVSPYLANYFNFFKEYRLSENVEVVRVEKIARKYYRVNGSEGVQYNEELKAEKATA
jgi:hypothetical protein